VRILEDFHRVSALERVFLSGGLSSLNCLQQGIAQCVSYDVHLLPEVESSLRGAALLAAGKPPVSDRVSHKISKEPEGNKLREKYQRWNIWLEELLITG
jgi:glycerol kinase